MDASPPQRGSNKSAQGTALGFHIALGFNIALRFRIALGFNIALRFRIALGFNIALWILGLVGFVSAHHVH
jgi:hypothetical protein